jgi:hypothetical protein
MARSLKCWPIFSAISPTVLTCQKRTEIRAALAPYTAAPEVYWVQEEPWNMGAWHDMSRRLRRILPPECPVEYAGRAAAASPASGSYTNAQMDVIVEVDMNGNIIWEWAFFDLKHRVHPAPSSHT